MDKTKLGPLVSVIIPTYNRATSIIKTIRSVFAQTYKNYEIIVIDDFSDDNTQELLDEYKPRISYYKHEINRGANAARNNGILKSKGEYIAFLDSDDVWSSTKLEDSINAFLENKNCDVVFTGYNIIETHNKRKNSKEIKEGNIFKDQLLKDYVSPTSAVMLKSECLKNNFFDENLPARQDYDLWIRLSEQFSFKYINKTLVDIYYLEKNRISHAYEKQVKGTQIILKKIKSNYYSQLTKKEMKEIEESQLRHIYKIYYFNDERKKARHIARELMGVNRGSKKNIGLYFISYVPYRIVNKIRKGKKNNERNTKKHTIF
ncbi:glycosyltransferase family 2 protein [Alkalicoccobacillus plakortidis]|uniref:Glycosyltransferase n=1 Tax=Alkalicoccobacillus plakortidis TaxID=444060 RepID=A0ABT0XJ38_9BACI|nr:glycosyltransferase [Alkalicoccobacillus plakortidis]MCM2675917.1 glycosyltransferase [Alkalicoccobacillus plakortidis]